MQRNNVSLKSAVHPRSSALHDHKAGVGLASLCILPLRNATRSSAKALQQRSVFFEVRKAILADAKFSRMALTAGNVNKMSPTDLRRISKMFSCAFMPNQFFNYPAASSFRGEGGISKRFQTHKKLRCANLAGHPENRTAIHSRAASGRLRETSARAVRHFCLLSNFSCAQSREYCSQRAR